MEATLTLVIAQNHTKFLGPAVGCDGGIVVTWLEATGIIGALAQIPGMFYFSVLFFSLQDNTTIKENGRKKADVQNYL